VNYVERNGTKVVTDTRTSQALERAGVPKDEWGWVNKTGDRITEGRVDRALNKSKLDEPTMEVPSSLGSPDGPFR
jgi:hypothetical protein